MPPAVARGRTIQKWCTGLLVRCCDSSSRGGGVEVCHEIGNSAIKHAEGERTHSSTQTMSLALHIKHGLAPLQRILLIRHVSPDIRVIFFAERLGAIAASHGL